MKVYKL